MRVLCGTAAPAPAAPAPAAAAPKPAAPAPAASAEPAQAQSGGGRVYASPFARRIAELRNIRLGGEHIFFIPFGLYLNRVVKSS